MADVGTVSTDIYRPLQAPQSQAMTPLDAVRLIGGLQENQIRQRNLDALQAIGGAYSRNVSPTGDMDVSGLRSDIARNGGVLAGEGLSQATANSDADLKLRSSWQQTLRGIYGQLSTQTNVSDDALAAAKVAAAGAGVPPGVIQNFTSTMPRVQSAKDQNARRQWLVTQSNLARSPSEIAQGTEGPIDASGVRRKSRKGKRLTNALVSAPHLAECELLSRLARVPRWSGRRQTSRPCAQRTHPILTAWSPLMDLSIRSRRLAPRDLDLAHPN